MGKLIYCAWTFSMFGHTLHLHICFSWTYIMPGHVVCLDIGYDRTGSMLGNILSLYMKYWTYITLGHVVCLNTGYDRTEYAWTILGHILPLDIRYVWTYISLGRLNI